MVTHALSRNIACFTQLAALAALLSSARFIGSVRAWQPIITYGGGTLEGAPYSSLFSLADMVSIARNVWGYAGFLLEALSLLQRA